VNRSHYETLGIARNATPAMVKAGFQAKMKALEESALDEAARAAHEKSLQQAFVTLFNPAGKAKYDRQLAVVAAVQPVRPHQVASTNPLVFAGAVAAIAAAVAGGWYVTHPSAERQAQARKEAAARNKASRPRLDIAPPVPREAKKQ
jgi:alkanesulfonate monooxygenase SsuD/methylene tetrahydromethanopterin reductase-like flavin-dependent oxidoreductase (luciferase family)